MRNLLLALLVANLLYFIWGLRTKDDDEPGVAVLEESELGPPLERAQKPRPENDSAAASQEEGYAGELVGMVGRSCVSVGPFRERGEAEEARARYVAEDMTAKVRSGFGEVFVGHWVQIRDVPDLEASRQMITTLHDGGLTDAYPIETEDEGRKISLGVFGNIERAQNVRDEAVALGMEAEITPRTTEGTVYWADIGLPPGRGASEIVELYGEERVLLRDRATCPRN